MAENEINKRKSKITTGSIDPETNELIIYTGLTESQELFCKFRAEGFSITQAYRRAFPKSQNPSIDGWQLEQKEKILNRISILRKERASSAKSVDPNESLARWNFLYHLCLQNGDIKGMMEAQKNIDDINGAKNYTNPDILRDKNLFIGEDENWNKTAKALMEIALTKAPKPAKNTPEFSEPLQEESEPAEVEES